MVNIINVADLVDPGDFQGRTYRQINSELKHQFAVGDLIELTKYEGYKGVRLYVVEQTRDCDQTPLYNLGFIGEVPEILSRGHSEYSMKKVGKRPTEHRTPAQDIPPAITEMNRRYRDDERLAAAAEMNRKFPPRHMTQDERDAMNRALDKSVEVIYNGYLDATDCPNALLPDGPVCPRCGGRRGPSGVDGGSWVHF